MICFCRRRPLFSCRLTLFSFVAELKLSLNLVPFCLDRSLPLPFSFPFRLRLSSCSSSFDSKSDASSPFHSYYGVTCTFNYLIRTLVISRRVLFYVIIIFFFFFFIFFDSDHFFFFFLDCVSILNRPNYIYSSLTTTFVCCLLFSLLFLFLLLLVFSIWFASLAFSSGSFLFV